VHCGFCATFCPHGVLALENKTSMISYDYELIYALGTMLGVSDPEGALRLMDEVEVWGLDAMSTGVVLAWATEAQQRGLVGEQETGGLLLAWGDWQTYLEAMSRIVEQPSEFYRALARGAEHAAARYGGREFALTFGGNEMPGYHTGPAAHLGYLLGARHGHLCNAPASPSRRCGCRSASSRRPGRPGRWTSR